MKNKLTPAIIGLTSLVVYLFTMLPSIYTGDSGEIASAIYVWGIAHPTGFPSYIIFAKLFSYLFPWLEFAYRLNIFSALLGSATVIILFFILKKLQIKHLPSAVASISLAFAYTFWTHAGTIQAYSLTAFFFALTILLLFHWLTTKKEIYFYISAIISGIGMGTHLTFILIFPFIFILIFIKNKKLLTPKRLILFTILLLTIATIIYSYIPLRASQSPEFNWGNPSNKESFIYYITQREWSFKISNRNTESWGLMLKEVGKLFSREFTWLGLFFILIGIVGAFKKYQPLFYAGISVIIFNILLLGNYGNSGDINHLWRYFLPSYIIMAIFLAIGLSETFKTFFTKKNDFMILKIIVASILPIAIFGVHFNELNQHNNLLVQNTMNNVFETIPQKSIFLVAGDTNFGAVKYYQLVLKKRQDLLILDTTFFDRSWYRKQKKEEIIKKGFKYATSIPDIIIKNKNAKVYSLFNYDPLIKISNDVYPKGIVYEYKIKKKTDPAKVKQMNDAFWQNRDLKFLKNKKFNKDILAQEMILLHTSALSNLGIYLANNGFVKEGIAYLEKSLDIRENQLALYDLMLIYNALGEQEKASKYNNKFNLCQKLYTGPFCEKL